MKNLLFHFGRKAESQRPSAAGTCHNCHAEVSTAFCGACGQKAKVHIASAHEFVHHFIGHYVAAEGKLWRTLGWLFARPGQLTVEFIRGRRGQFIDPLRLLLTISLLMFLVMKWQVYHLPAAVPDAQAVQAQAAAAPATVGQATHKVDRSLFGLLTSASPQFPLNYGKFLALPEQTRDAQLWETWLRVGPSIMLCLIPLMAVVLKLLHLGTGWRYGEHLVFSIHLQTVSLVAVVLVVGGMRQLTKEIMFAAMALYILLALRKVYGGGWIVLLLRTCILGYWLTWAFEWLTRSAFLLRFT